MSSFGYNKRTTRTYRRKTSVEKFVIAAQELYSVSRLVMKLFRKAAPTPFKIQRTYTRLKGSAWK